MSNLQLGAVVYPAVGIAAAWMGWHIKMPEQGTLLAGPPNGELPLVSVLVKQLHLQGVLVGSRSQQESMIKAIHSTGIRPVIDREFALDDLVAAFKYQEKISTLARSWSPSSLV